MARKLDQVITAAEKQRQIEIAYNIYTAARPGVLAPDRGVFAMGFLMGMRRGYALATDADIAIEKSILQGMGDA